MRWPGMMRIVAIGTTALLLASGCGWLDEEADDSLAPLDKANPSTEADDNGDLEPPELERDPETCPEDELRLDDSDDSDFVSAHRVVNGQLGPLCFGEGDWTMLLAWNILSAIGEPEQLALLTRLVGYASSGEDDAGDTTVAYVYTADDEGREFQMSINLDVAREDDDELTLTVVHEFSHVLSRNHTQMDRFSDPVQCNTYDSGEGCFEENSYIAMWIDEFWGQWLDDLDPTQDAGTALGEPRCASDAGFLNDYAASSPEEDFAEAFSAFILDVDVPPSVQPRMDFFERFPEFTAMRQRALIGELGPLPDTFTGCG